MTNDKSNHDSVSDEQVASWANEAETGYDVAELKQRGRPRLGSGVAQVATVRLDPDLDAALTSRAETDNMTRSEVLRAALQSWLVREPTIAAPLGVPTTWDRPGLEAAGFTGFVPLLGMDRSKLPPRRGIYVVLRDSATDPLFVSHNPITTRAPYSLDRLNAKVTRSHPIVYIGKADSKGGLRERLGAFSKQATNHSGGRALWQLHDAQLLLAAWLETPDQVSEELEKVYIAEFSRLFGDFPLANWRK
jgi:hypothetical protein